MSIDTIIKISGTIPANTTTNDIAALDIPEDGEILCIAGIITGTYEPAAAAGANITLRLLSELSFLSTNQIAVNDSRGAIAGLGVATLLFFSEAAETGGGGAKLSEVADICPPEGIAVNAGERIHLHGLSSDTNLTGTTTYLLYLKTRGGGRRAVKRR